MRSCIVLATALVACSGAPPTPDAGPDAGPTEDSGTPDAGRVVTATMSLFETQRSDGGVRLQSFVTIARAGPGDGGCVTGPKPTDLDGAWLRISGYAATGQPIVCMNEDGGYVCRFPSGAEVDVTYDAGSDPLGAGPISFATGGGADLSAAIVPVSPGGTLSATLDGGTLALSCSDDCSAARVVVMADTLRCDLAFAPTLTLPFAPGPVSVVRAVSAATDDHHGAALIGRVGRGVSLP